MDGHTGTEELSDEEHFEDFTTASDWELFTANLEHLLVEWQSRPVEAANVHHKWTIFNDNILFIGLPFQVSYFKARETPAHEEYLLSSSTDSVKSSQKDLRLPPFLNSITEAVNEFPLKFSPHVVAELFHLTEFAVISPTNKSLQNESELKLILSSACIALNNTNSNFPVLVQYLQRKQNYFCGVAETGGIRTCFQMIHLRNYSKEYNYLSGLLALFNSKMGTKLSVPIHITAHFFYNTKVWHPDYTFETEFVDVMECIKSPNTNTTAPSNENSNNVATTNSWKFHAFTKFLPFGCSDDPFLGMSFVVGWPSLTEDAVVDTSTYSDLDPNQAPEWYFSFQANNQLDFRLTEMLEGVWNLQKDSKSVEDILGKKFEKEDTQFTSALDRISLGISPLPVVNRVINNVNKAQKQLLFSPIYTDLPPIEKEDMDFIVNYLFPDAVSNSKYSYPQAFDVVPEFSRTDLQSLTDAFQGVKSAPMGSLVWRLAIILSHHATAGYGNLAHIWAELILELRYRWDNSILISGLESGAPNSATCLLNQKLQMLNCCIEKKLSREKQEVDVNEEDAADTAAESDEEFFDCDDNLSVEEHGTVERLQKPAGRLSKCGRLRLLKSGEPLYIPITQDPAPLTEDGFEEQTKMLVELGDDDQGTEQRAKLMSASLVSDMQSFKAANPGCCLEDFVRWYSPRDWIESDTLDDFGSKCGELSVRMKMPGNLWLEVWSSTAGVPARRQKRLFDDTQEAEKILSWLSSRSIRDISQLIFPCLIHAATLKVLDEADDLKAPCNIPSTLIQHLTQLTKNLGIDVLQTMFGKSGFERSTENYNNSSNGSHAYKVGLLSSIGQIEREICQLRSFQQKLPEIDLNEALKVPLREGEQRAPPPVVPYLLPQYIKVNGGSAVGKRIRDIFQKEVLVHDNSDAVNEFKFGDPVKKVFVLKYVPAKSGTLTTESLPQRMSCCIKKNEFKVAGTFSIQTGLG